MISKIRLEAFSDGVFAIAITLLVLQMRVPDMHQPSDQQALAALLSGWHQYLVYAASFFTIGVGWFGHYALFHNLQRVSYTTLMFNMLLLLLVSFLPFPTLVIVEYGLSRPVVMFYDLVLFAIAVIFSVLYYVAALREGKRASIEGYLRTRNLFNLLGPVVYGISTLLAVVSPVASIGLDLFVAAYYATPVTLRAAFANSPDDRGA